MSDLVGVRLEECQRLLRSQKWGDPWAMLSSFQWVPDRSPSFSLIIWPDTLIELSFSNRMAWDIGLWKNRLFYTNRILKFSLRQYSNTHIEMEGSEFQLLNRFNHWVRSAGAEEQNEIEPQDLSHESSELGKVRSSLLGIILGTRQNFSWERWDYHKRMLFYSSF